MSNAFYASLGETLQQIEQDGFTKRERQIATPQGANIRLSSGNDVINFCANNYLGLADDPRLIAAAKQGLDDFGFGGPNLRTALTSIEKDVVRMGVEPMKIEIRNYLNGVDFAEAYDRRITRNVEDIKIDVISLQDLIANKEDVGRLQDLLDVEKLKERNGL